MKKCLLAVSGLFALAFSSNANAALTITIAGASGTFGNSTVVCPPGPTPCAFANLANFVTPIGYRLVGVTLSSIMTGTNSATNIDFTVASLNGVNFAVTSFGDVEFRRLQNLLLIAGANNTLRIEGITGGDASYAGTLSFAAVPEPSVWAMMILGIGIIGVGLRQRRTVLSYS